MLSAVPVANTSRTQTPLTVQTVNPISYQNLKPMPANPGLFLKVTQGKLL